MNDLIIITFQIAVVLIGSLTLTAFSLVMCVFIRELWTTLWRKGL
jgi:hypothetical protein